MKKSKFVQLVLITAALAGADKIEAQSNGASGDWDKQPEKYGGRIRLIQNNIWI